MNKFSRLVCLLLAEVLVTGCATTRLEDKVLTWQKERPYAEKIKEVRMSGRQLRSSDVDLFFTLDDFKKELPAAAVSIEAVIVMSKTVLNIGAEVVNSSSPLYVAAVDSVDRKWIMYIGRDVETDAGGDIEKYLLTIDPEYREQAKKDWEDYQKIIKYVPDPALLERGKNVCDRYYEKDEQGNKTLNVAVIESLPYTGKKEDQEDYAAFLVYRDHTPEIQKEYDNALKAKLTALLAKINSQVLDLTVASNKLSDDPEVSKLNIFDLALTLKGVCGGIVKVFADPISKINGALDGYSLADDIDKLAMETQKIDQCEAEKAKKD
ncbi:MAG: hypothetical protein IJR99_03155 [Kiritimatiellae bacterium]|nr:hypothetical protein [Kiritimatiellia bacterium]